MSTSSKNLHPFGFNPARAAGGSFRQPLLSLSFLNAKLFPFRETREASFREGSFLRQTRA